MIPCNWSLRPPGHSHDPYKEYRKHPTVCSIKINHGGAFTSPPNRRYRGGIVNWFDDVDTDSFSVIEVSTMLKELGYVSQGMQFYYKIPNANLDNGLVPLKTDMDVLDMAKYVSTCKVIDVFVDHPVDEAVFPNKNVSDLGNERSGISQSSSKNKGSGIGQSSYKVKASGIGQSSSKNKGSGIGQSSSKVKASGPNVSDTPLVSEENDSSDSDSSVDSEDSEDSDFDVDQEDMINDVEVDMADFRKHVDENVEWGGSTDKEVPHDEPFDFEEVDLEDYDSVPESDEEEFERRKALKKLAKKNKPVDGKIYSDNFYAGQTFPNKEMIKEMVTRISVEQRRELHFTRNDKTRLRAECRGIVPVFSHVDGTENDGRQQDGPSVKPNDDKPNVASDRKKGSNIKSRKRVVVEDNQSCPWLLHCSKSKNQQTWWVKVFDDNHTCLQSRNVRKCTATFLSKQVQETIQPNPKIPLAALKDQLQKKYELGVSKMKVFRAKQIAEDRVIGDYINQYAQLKQYALELQERNPDTTIKFEVERDYDVDKNTRQFKRIYICLGALKSGFKAGKRDLLGLDGCFMSGPYPGQILTAVGVDPNNGTYPLAYAVVESETKDSWLWFLDCLGDDLELYRNSNFTFITDRQKGLIPTLQETFPAAEHRYCLKHIYDNMKLSWRGQQYKDLLWRCATATTVQLFTRNMEELKKTNKEVYDWLNKIPPQHWARSHFSGRAHCDVLLNNMCEVLNRQLVDGRDKPIITSLEFIREYLMKRIVIVQQAISKSTGPLTPNATKIFNAILKAAAQYTVTWNGGDLYQACGPWGDKCVVNMNLRSCSCRKWELTGMPCKHAVAAIWNMAANGMEPGIPESWVHESYWLKTWEEMYRFKINPVDGPEMWKNADIPITLTPPNYVPPIGRPRKKRQKSAGELYDGLVKNGRLSRAGKTVTCGKCGQQGHNKSSCKGQRESANVRPKARKGTTPKARQRTTPSSTPSATTAATPSATTAATPAATTAATPAATQAATPAATQAATPAAPSQSSAQPFAPGSPSRFTKTSAKRLSPLK